MKSYENQGVLPGLGGIFFPTIDAYKPRYPDAPTIGPEYRNALSKLVLLQDDGVTIFKGGPLDLGPEMQSAWMCPVAVQGRIESSYFQLIFVNTSPDDALNNDKVPVTRLDIEEIGHKLTTPNSHSYDLLLDQFRRNRPEILLRTCTQGMAYFPQVILPSEKEYIDTHLEQVIMTAGLQEPDARILLGGIAGVEKAPIPNTDVTTHRARKYLFAGKMIYSYELILERDKDPWGLYEIFTPKPMASMPKDDVLIRVDSGCDIGQIFDDRGCDCREQLHTALKEIQTRGDGAVLHIPAQDGRGFGAATKMETEGMKRGIAVATNKENPKALDTVEAARDLLGQNFDIRTYEGAGRILAELGIGSVILQTDNRQKVEGITKAGIAVTRKPTNTTAYRGAAEHVAAKHRLPMYSWDDSNPNFPDIHALANPTSKPLTDDVQLF